MHIEDRILLQEQAVGPLGTVSLAGMLSAGRGVSSRPMRVLGAFAVVFLDSGGGAYMDARGVRKAVLPGDAILLFPEIPHAYGPQLSAGSRSGRPPRSWNELYAAFSGPIFETMRSAGVLSPEAPVLPAPRGWGDRLYACLTETRGSFSTARLLQFSALLAELYPTAAPLANRSWVDQAQRLLTANLSNPLRLDEVSAQLSISPEGFRKRFRSETGTSPSRYRSAARIAAAGSLLLNTQMSLRAIADSLGFTDEFHLSHRFKHLKGVSPSTFRRNRQSV